MEAERPVDNAPYFSHVHNGLTIEGWSRAAVQSYWRIPELNIGFDLGAHPWDFMGTSRWFISHTHLDHIAALPVYLARRRMMKMEPPKVFVPVEAIEDIKRLLAVFQRLDRGRQAVELIPVSGGDRIELDRQHEIEAFDTVTTGIPAAEIKDEEIEDSGLTQEVQVFDTVHTIPSRGFVVYEVRHKLKAKYHEWPGNKIRDARLSGEEVTEKIRKPIVAYTGDTAPAGLDACEDCFKATILITEMSFIREKHRREKIHKFGHMHLDDFLERADRFQNELIVAGHFSTRYHPNEVIRLLEARLPPQLKSRMKLWI